MKLESKYLSKIDLDNIKNVGGFNWLCPLAKGVCLKNIKQIQFRGLYSNIICGIVDSGLHKKANDGLQKSLESFKNKYEYFEKNRSTIKLDPQKYKNYKTSINSFYGTLGFLSKTYKSPNYSGFVTEYLTYYYDELLEKNNSILYIDTDTIFYAGEIDLLGIDVSYSTDSIDYILFDSVKRYTMLKEEIITRGLFKDPKEAISLLRTYIRQDKLEQLDL